MVLMVLSCKVNSDPGNIIYIENIYYKNKWDLFTLLFTKVRTIKKPYPTLFI